MLRLLRSFLLLACFSLAVSCSKEEVPCICCLDDPTESIDWLKDIKVQMTQTAKPTGGQIIQYNYLGECVFWIDNCYNCADNLIVIYDAEQNIVCQFGGIIGLNTCPDFEKEATDEKVLFDMTG